METISSFTAKYGDPKHTKHTDCQKRSWERSSVIQNNFQLTSDVRQLLNVSHENITYGPW